MELVLSVSLAVLPTIVLLWYFSSHDLRPEPRQVLMVTFVLGVLAAAPVMAAGRLLATLYPDRLGTPMLEALAQAFLYAAIPEELCKFLILVGYCSRHKAFDEPMDGVIYGVTASLGFATVENIAYVAGGTWQLALARGLAAVPMHAFLGILLGYYVGQAHRHPERLSILANGLLFVIVLHALYDFPLLALWEMSLREHTPSAGLSILLYTITFSLLAVAGFSAVNIVRQLRRQQSGESAPSEELP